MKKILIFGFHGLADDMTVYRLKEAFEKTGVEIVPVKKEDYLLSLGRLADMMPEKRMPDKKEQVYQGAELPVRMLLFAGFLQEELEQALEVCRQSGTTREDLKAVLTPFNYTWNAISLCEELRKEHQQMRK